MQALYDEQTTLRIVPLSKHYPRDRVILIGGTVQYRPRPFRPSEDGQCY